jgi:hypothetical protein
LNILQRNERVIMAWSTTALAHSVPCAANPWPWLATTACILATAGQGWISVCGWGACHCDARTSELLLELFLATVARKRCLTPANVLDGE